MHPIDNLDGELALTLPATGAKSSTARYSPWLTLLETWHRAHRHVGPIILDSLVVGAVTAGVAARMRTSFLTVILFAGASLVFGVYQRRSPVEAQGVMFFIRPLVPVGVIIWAVLLTGVITTTADEAWQVAVAFMAALVAVRCLLWFVISSARRHGAGLQPTLVIGPADRIEQLEHRLRTYPEAGLKYVNHHVPWPGEGTRPDDAQQLIEGLLAQDQIAHVVCVADDIDETVFRDVVRFGAGRVDCSLVLPLAGLCARQTRSRIGDLGVVPIRLCPSWGSVSAKRVVDLILAAIALIVAIPLLALTAVAIRLGDWGPAIFRQARVGRDGHLFKMYKFRSMVVEAENSQVQYVDRNVNGGLLFKVSDDPRVTKVGTVIRRLSIDELPQLVNVIKGDMSLVGPRPLPVDPDDFDVAAQIRHQVLPGITGLWQVHGANALSYRDMVDLDLSYVTTHSLGLDLQILLRTAPALLVRRSAY